MPDGSSPDPAPAEACDSAEPTGNSSGTGGDLTPQRWRGGRRLFLVVAFPLFLIVTVVVCFPMLLSTGWGTGILVTFADRMIPGRVEINGLSLSWGAGQAVKKIRLYDPSGTVVLEIDGLVAPELSVVEMIRGRTDLGTVLVRHVRAEPDLVPAALINTLERRPVGAGDDTEPLSRSDADQAVRANDGVFVPWRGRLEIGETEVTYLVAGQSPLSVSASRMVVDRSQPTDLALAMSAEVVQGDLSGRLNIDIELGGLFDQNLLWQPGRVTPRKVNLVADVLPTAFLDRVLGMEGLAAELMGPTFSGRLEASGANISDFSGALELRSDAFVMAGRLRNAPQSISFTSSAPTTICITQDFYDVLADHFGFLAGTRLLDPVEVIFNIETLTVPIADGALDFSRATCRAEMTMDELAVDAGDVGVMGLKEARAEITTDALGHKIKVIAAASASHNAYAGPLAIETIISNLMDDQQQLCRLGWQVALKIAASDIPLPWLQQLLDLPAGVLEAVVGHTINADLEVSYDGSGESIPVHLALTSTRFEAVLQGKVAQAGGGWFHGHARGQVTPRMMTLMVDYYAVHLPEPIRGFMLHQPANLALSIDTLDVGASFDPSSLVVAGTLAVDRLATGGMDMLEDLVLRDMVVSIPRSTLVERLAFKMSADLDHGQGRGQLQLSAAIDQPLGRRTMATTVTLRGLSVADLERRFGKVGAWVPWLGRTVERVRLAVRRDPSVPTVWAFDAEAASATMVSATLAGRFSARQGVVELQSGTVVYRVRPSAVATLFETVAALPQATPLVLRKAVDVTGDLRYLVVGLTEGPSGGLQIDLQRSAIDLRVAMPTLPLMIRTRAGQEPLTLKSLSVTAAGAAGTFDVMLGGTVESVDPVTGVMARTPVTSRISVKNLLMESLSSGSSLVIMTDTKFPDMPVGLLDGLAGAQGKLKVILGPVASMRVVGAFPGDSVIAIRSDNAEVDVALRTKRQDNRYMIGLQRDMEAKLMPTEEAFRQLFGEVHPIFSDAVAAKKPVVLVVLKEPFHVPLPFDVEGMKQLHLDATLQIGTLSMRRRGWLTEGIDMLVEEASQVAKNMDTAEEVEVKVDTYDAKFSPLRVRVHHGKIKTSELWILSDDLAIGFQGGVEMSTGRYRFFMGIMGASLLVEEQRLVQVVDPENIYDIPITGVIGQDPVIDKAELTIALIGSAVKQQATAHAGEMGPFGQVLREGLDQLILKPRQAERRRRLGLQWHVPNDVHLFVARILKTLSEHQRRTPGQRRPVGERKVQARKHRDRDFVEDQLKKEAGKLLEGLFSR